MPSHKGHREQSFGGVDVIPPFCCIHSVELHFRTVDLHTTLVGLVTLPVTDSSLHTPCPIGGTFPAPCSYYREMIVLYYGQGSRLSPQ